MRKLYQWERVRKQSGFEQVTKLKIKPQLRLIFVDL